MSTLSKFTKEHIVVALANEVAGQELIEAIESAGGGGGGAVSSVNGQTGAVVLTKSSIGLSNVDNTSDLNKPVSSAVQTALNAKLDLAGGTMTGNINMESTSGGGTITITGIQSSHLGGLYTYDFPFLPPANAPITIKDAGIDLGTIAVDPFLFVLKYTPVPGSALPAATVQGVLPLFANATGIGINFLQLNFPDSFTPASLQASYSGGGVTTYSKVVGLANGVNPRDAVNKQQMEAAIAAIPASSPAVVQTIYVDKNYPGTYIADGSQIKPFKTLNEMYAAITDASASKKYCCVIAPGSYVEDDSIRLEPYIDLTCLANDTVSITTTLGTSLKWDNSNPGRLFISNIALLSGIEVANTNPSGTSGCVLDLDNVQAAFITFRGRGGGIDYIQLRNDCLVSGACTIQSASTTIFDSTIIGVLTLNDIACVIPDAYGSAITASLRSNYELGISISSTNYDVYVDAWGNNPISNLTINSNSAYPCTFNSDASSYPNAISLSGSPAPVLNRTSGAPGLNYTPAVAGDWAAPAPETIQQAIDRIAALVKTLNSGTPIP